MGKLILISKMAEGKSYNYSPLPPHAQGLIEVPTLPFYSTGKKNVIFDLLASCLFFIFSYFRYPSIKPVKVA